MCMQYVVSYCPFIRSNRLSRLFDRYPLEPTLHAYFLCRSRAFSFLALVVISLTLSGCQDDTLVDIQPPSQPTELSVTVLSMTQIRISWEASTDNVAVTSYRVLRNGEYIGVTNSTVYLDTTATASELRHYEVIAVDRENNASFVSIPVQSDGFQAAHIPQPD